MAKSDVLVRMKADTSGYDANIAKARRQLDQFKQDNLTLGGVLKQTTGSIVTAAAKYASFAAVLGTVANGFQNVISEGSRMAKEMEGVKMAFDRLNQPGLLDGLRQATHNTVNDLELMKNAVKFDNFGLSLEQMGTFLAFAQQQAKDTGQSVEYLVDSIVTGLGRKSLPILDNLGLSATEIRERMAETGDMTKAVADIIKDRMDKAGGYIETASDRAAQAQVKLDNAMTELGNTFNTLTGSAASLWTELEVGAVNLLNTAIKPLIAAFNSLVKYINGQSTEDIITNSLTDVTDTVDDNGKLIRKNAIQVIPEITVTGSKNKVKPKKVNTKNTKPTPEIPKHELAAVDIDAMTLGQLTPEPIPIKFDVDMSGMTALQMLEAQLENLKEQQEAFGGVSSEVWQHYQELINQAQAKIDEFKGKTPVKNLEEDADGTAKAFGKAAGAISSVGSAMSQIEDPTAKILGMIAEAIATIALGFSQAIGKDIGKNGNVWYAIAAAAAGVASMITTISAIHSATGYAQGGVIEGTHYSGDMEYARVNAGETILTRAQAGNLVSQLEGGGLQNLRLSATISGEQIRLALNNNGRRTGRGEYVTTNFQRG